MLERIDGWAKGVVGLRAAGRVTKEDYERVVEPLLEEARAGGTPIRVLVEFGADFEGFTPAAVWEDVRLGRSASRALEALAITTDIGWIRVATRASAFFLPCPVRVFGLAERAAALEWLGSQKSASGLTHRLLPDKGVVVVEIRGPLRAQDFDALALTVDAWMEVRGDLHGIVVQAKKFPGWENLSGLLRHFRFVRDHHRRVRRIAVAADGAMAEIAPRLASPLVSAEVKRFAYDALDAALAWASGDVAS